MARPIKPGLNYFPRDTDIHANRRIRKLCAQHGAQGFMIFDHLLCLIYSEKGYYLPYNGDLCFDVADFLHCGITTLMVTEVIATCIQLELFHAGMFNDHSILTSASIQKHYCTAKRHKTGISTDHALIVIETGVIAAETPGDEQEPPDNVAESTQRKEKQRKEKQQGDDAFSRPTLETFVAYFASNGYSTVVAEEAWQKYESVNWRDGQGQPIRYWQRMCETVWFLPKYKTATPGAKRPMVW